jgi:hypothetical protein
MVEKKQKLYVVMNRTEPLGVFATEFTACRHALDHSRHWVQPIRVFELELESFDYERIVATFQKGRRL